MRNSSLSGASMFSFASGVVLLALLTFGVLNWIGMPIGSFVDWLIGIVTFVWLMTVVTVPWNIHFEAKEVLNDAKTSKEKNIQFDDNKLNYVRKLAFWGLTIALILHLLSAAVLYWLAYTEVSQVGYYGAIAALLLTFLRPSVRAYQYISMRLYSIRQEILYPRDDVATLYGTLEDLKYQLQDIQRLLDINEQDSWRNVLQGKLILHQNQLSQLKANLDYLTESNQKEHERISKETQHAVAQLSEDGKFIDNLVEIIRFIKKV